MTTFVPLLTREWVEWLPERAREVVKYRKSGLSAAPPLTTIRDDLTSENSAVCTSW
ncbi:MAG: hypothetical protein JO100_06550 [Pseudonocardia sp.]|nr:hypothetical protein [Pseudonocardia sp.]